MQICLDQRTNTGCAAQNRDNAQFCQQCGRPLRYALQLHDPGVVVGNYRIVQLIGYGGFGAVYEAEDRRQPGLRIALKETFDSDQIRSFQGEFAVLSRLQHPHLPRYYATFEENGNGYLAMEFVPGQNLQDVLDKQRGPLLEAQVLGYALQLCDALAYLHSQNPPIIHRDIKPANVRLTPEGLIKLVDFGLVKEGTDATRSSRRAVTPAYAPIEQWGMAGQHTDPRSDIYSLGATLYHLLTGQAPPPATDRIARTPDPLMSPRSINSGISQHVAEAVIAATSVQIAARPSDAGKVKLALLGFGQPTPAKIPAQPAPKPQSPQPPTPPTPAATKRRHPIHFDWVTIPAGEFLMGSDKQQDRDAQNYEQPQHRLYLAEFQIARVPVTNLQYKTFTDAAGHPKPSHWGGGRIPAGKEEHPVVMVSWHDALAFCQWAGVRLPTEAEWEKAARGSDGRIFPWGDEAPDQTRFDLYIFSDDSLGIVTTAVGKYPRGASPYGCLDMAGNVLEWTSSSFKNYPYNAGDGRENPTDGGSRVLRGGGVRCARRIYGLNPNDRNFSVELSVGFRVLSPGH